MTMKRTRIFHLHWIPILLVFGGSMLLSGTADARSQPRTKGRTATDGMITGTVTDVSGNPIPGFMVTAGDYDSLINGDISSGPYSEASDQDGFYQIPVPPGTYLVYINSHQQPGQYLPEAYSNINSWSSINLATPVSVAAGQTVTGVDFILTTGFSLSGRLVDAQGQPVLGAGGHIESLIGSVEYGWAFGFASSDVDGTFRVNLPAGAYDLFFGTESEEHTVYYGLFVGQNLDLGDVLFAEGTQPLKIFLSLVLKGH
jgi:hypothetical protein